MKMSSYFRIYSHKNKLLIDHLKNVGHLSKEFIRRLDLNFQHKYILEEIIYLVGISHDFAKATTFFQKKLNDEKYETEKADHSYLSSVFSYWLTKRYLKEKYNNGEFIKYLPYFAWLIVAKHHGDLENWFDNGNLFRKIRNADYIKDQIEDIYKNSIDELQRIYDILLRELSFTIDVKIFLKDYQKIFLELEEGLEEDLENFLKPYRDNINLEKYLEFLLLYSSLIDADKFDALYESREFDEIKSILFDRIDLSGNLVDDYKKIMFSISKTQLDKIRERAYNEIIRNIDEIDLKKDRIFSINLPTGSGKTLSAFSFAIKLRNKLKEELSIRPRIIYSLPFLSIIDQNAKVIAEVMAREAGLDWRTLADLNERDKTKILEEKIPTDLLLKHHHLADIKYEKRGDNKDKEEFEKDEALSLMDGWYSEIIITTFVQFFQSLITNKNSAIRKVHNIPNSIIILDEFQSIPYKYWGLTRELLNSLTTMWNCYIIIMTATMPMILEGSVIPLIKKPNDYFKDKNFDRVDILIDKEEKELMHFIDEIYNRILNSQGDILVILNTIKSSQKMYLKIREKLIRIIGKPKITEEGIADFGELCLINLNANIIPFHRLQRINKIKQSSKRKIIISTQLVEAGVDIDIDIIYRDLAPIDSLVQSAGRCNRNNSKSRGKVHIINLVDENRRKSSIKIYGEILIQATQNILKDYNKIVENEIKDVVEKYFREVKERKYTEGREFIKQVCNLEFDKIKEFSLIKEEFGRKDVCVLVDGVEELIEKTRRLKKELVEADYKERFKIVPEIKSLRRKLEQFIISPFLGEKDSILNSTHDDKLFLYVLDPGRIDIYQKEMGFLVNVDDEVWIV